MNTQINDYQAQANDFLASTKTSFAAKYLKTGKYFNDDKEERDIYEIELKRGNREYKFNFGQSIHHSGECIISIYVANQLKLNRRFASKLEVKKLNYGLVKSDIVPNKNYSMPTAYDVLAALTKYDPGTFENFCSEFGYDTDSKRAEKTYKAVQDEWMNVCKLFTDEEIELLQEIS